MLKIKEEPVDPFNCSPFLKSCWALEKGCTEAAKKGRAPVGGGSHSDVKGRVTRVSKRDKKIQRHEFDPRGAEFPKFWHTCRGGAALCRRARGVTQEALKQRACINARADLAHGWRARGFCLFARVEFSIFAAAGRCRLVKSEEDVRGTPLR